MIDIGVLLRRQEHQVWVTTNELRAKCERSAEMRCMDASEMQEASEKIYVLDLELVDEDDDDAC